MDLDQAGGHAAARVADARLRPRERLRLAAAFYPAHVPGYQRAELTFLRWELERGVLDPVSGSPWWRAVNDRLLRDKLAARALWDAGADTAVPGVRRWLEFLAAPSPATWYRAHNRSIVTGYLDNARLAEAELPPERFMMNVTLVRVLFAHALAERPDLALGRLGRAARYLADPRGGSVRMFLDLRNVFPERYPLHGMTIDEVLAREGRVARTIDYGLVLPKLSDLYRFAADRLDEPRLPALAANDVLRYARTDVGRDMLRPDPLSRWAAALTGARTR
ncbi:hypothetical protein [Nocardia blacklockiae]|uniref:hypothetical protein n=1 Tax=Nocardia blacklockiae TaxID=480036 RepID=UPI0018931AB9|nr:hypothetical protein [Nocardia blacklockiae]MBF6175846.1 hypothetical protein [Nocardia blacklockiae]